MNIFINSIRYYLNGNVITIEQPARNISLEAPYTQIVQILKSGETPIQNTP